MTPIDDKEWLPKSRKCFTIHLYKDGDILLLPDVNSVPLIESDIKQVDAFVSELRDDLVLAYQNEDDWSDE